MRSNQEKSGYDLKNNSIEVEKEEASGSPTLSMASSDALTFFKPGSELAAHKLMDYLLTGGEFEALKTIAKNPETLFIKTTGTDCARDLEGKSRLFIGSPYQALLAMGHVSLLREIAPYLKKNIQLAIRQFYEQFPEGIEKSCAYDYNPLVTLINDDPMNDGKPNTATLLGLAKFREDFKLGIVASGFLFDFQCVFNALEEYKKWINKWNPSQSGFFFVSVIGYLQSLVTTHDAQEICDYGYWTCEMSSSESLKSPLILIEDGGYYFSHDEKRLGVDCGIDLDGLKVTESDSADQRGMWQYMGSVYKKRREFLHHFIENLLEELGETEEIDFRVYD